MALYGLESKRKPVTAAAPIVAKRFAANAREYRDGKYAPVTPVSTKLYGEPK